MWLAVLVGVATMVIFYVYGAACHKRGYTQGWVDGRIDLADRVREGETVVTWDYRVVSKDVGDGETLYAIHEALYNGGEKPHSISQDPVSLVGETVQELEDDLQAIQQAFSYPVLRFEEF